MTVFSLFIVLHIVSGSICLLVGLMAVFAKKTPWLAYVFRGDLPYFLCSSVYFSYCHVHHPLGGIILFILYCDFFILFCFIRLYGRKKTKKKLDCSTYCRHDRFLYRYCHCSPCSKYFGATTFF